MTPFSASKRAHNNEVFKRLCRVQMWKQLFHKLRYGVADRPLNFNKVRVEKALFFFQHGRFAAPPCAHYDLTASTQVHMVRFLPRSLPICECVALTVAPPSSPARTFSLIYRPKKSGCAALLCALLFSSLCLIFCLFFSFFLPSFLVAPFVLALPWRAARRRHRLVAMS